MMKRFFAILKARNIEFVRDRAALAWNIGFPVLVVAGFAVAFSSPNQDLYKLGIPSGAVGPEGILQTRHVQVVREPDLEASLLALRRHQLDMVVEGNRYWVNSSSPKGYLLERVLWGTETDRARLKKETVEGREIRYVDWLISGLLAMNMMFNALFGVGYVIVRYRKNGMLKRLKATPLSAFEFLSAQIVSRLLMLIGTTILVYFGCHLFLHFQMLGSYWDLLVVMTLGALCLISVGLLIACRISSEEFAGGLLNLISWPMMFLSGVWFSLEGTHPVVRAVAQVFPLTHVIDSARAIMTEGKTLSQVSGHLVVLASISIVCMFVGSIGFKWE